MVAVASTTLPSLSKLFRVTEWLHCNASMLIDENHHDVIMQGGQKPVIGMAA